VDAAGGQVAPSARRGATGPGRGDPVGRAGFHAGGNVPDGGPPDGIIAIVPPLAASAVTGWAYVTGLRAAAPVAAVS